MYRVQTLQFAIDEILTKDRKILLQNKEKTDKSRLTLVTTNCPALKNLNNILKQFCLFFTLTKEWLTFSMIRQWLCLNVQGTERKW